MAHKILVLDDEESYANMLRSLLEQKGFLAKAFTSPEEAAEELQNEDYHLIVSDFKMPVMDGAKFLEKVRGIAPTLPVIFVTGLMNTPELIKVANMGVSLVLEKPIDIDEFLEHVKHFVYPVTSENSEALKADQKDNLQETETAEEKVIPRG